ncbi:nitroreductase family deazaflavin-dependent oxidoreductase [Streptomyces sp. H39-S7]|uniref:nitroreductase family deazaflavin-dependent oxidoreductase n=1 Tax=Streptomyces sp. H39-S7 TaxID=3004357 RepID=UPI0022AF7997|nr:nitroreductase family deazaflavin-dependent oxidoreductase [Streptomyces sp. H39-S7]MCZ4118548.1 nitroreductase family deazaflavin-dependent oxidoreductase [Streptomyces sp. H39-S7]
MKKSLMERSKPLVQKVSSTRGFAKVAPYVVPAMDKVVHRLTKGKVLLSAQMLPGVVLTATGAKSGQPRRTPLACMPEDGGTFILVGSNFGRTDHPAWTSNLIRHPDAEINWKGNDLRVVAQLLEGAEREAAWTAVLRFWPPYASYAERVDRQIRLFRLVPRGPGGTEPGPKPPEHA